MFKIKTIGLLIFSLVIGTGLYAQSSDLKSIINKGVAEYDLGNYPDALRYFKQAYQMNKESKEACYQIALTYLALDENENAAIFSGKLMLEENEYRKDAYLINASAWDNLGREFKARRMYEEGLKLYPSSYLLHYNLALNLKDAKEYDEAMFHAISAIELKPDHSSSHLLLAYIMYDKGDRIQSMLPLYYFLLIEPNSERSITAYEFLQRLWKQGIRDKGQKEIRLVKAGYNYNDFAKVEFDLSEKVVNQDGSDPLQYLAHNTQNLFQVLSDSSEDKSGFWWEFYVKFFSRVQKEDLSESFCYFISNCKYKDDVLIWGRDHGEEFQRLMNWIVLL